MWLIFALISPILHGFANVFDNYFAGNIFKRVSTLTFFSTLFGFILLPIVILISTPKFPPLTLLPYFLVLGLIDVLYTIPYYKALKEEDTSIVTALFSIGHIFVPILAFLFVKERLTSFQYMGFILIIISSTLLALDKKVRFRINKAFFYMFAVSILLAIETVIYKYIFISVDWSTGFVWSVAFSFIMASSLLFFKNTRMDIKENFKVFKRKLPLFALEELCTFGGSAAAIFAISLVPVTLVEGVGNIQPLLVMMYALLLGKLLPQLFKEKVDKKSILKKSLFFLIMTVGVFMTVS